MGSIVLFIGVATIIIMGDEGASGVVGIAHSSKHILIGEPSGNYNGTALIRWVQISFFSKNEQQHRFKSYETPHLARIY